MRLIVSVVAILAFAAITQADDNLWNEGQTRQAQSFAISQVPSESAVGDGKVQLVQYARPIRVQQQVYNSPAARQSQPIGGRLMELERRKNAWLRRTFLGRD